MPDFEETQYGFKWGSLEVTRIAALPNGSVCIRARTPTKSIEIYASPAGKSLRVFGAGEWKPVN